MKRLSIETKALIGFGAVMATVIILLSHFELLNILDK